MLFKIGATAVGEAWALGTTWRRNARARRGGAAAGASGDAPDAGREMQEMHSADGGAAPDDERPALRWRLARRFAGTDHGPFGSSLVPYR